jgi:ElaB/YqjD/DUF883 family membrane-anchored ribosome-binding protein
MANNDPYPSTGGFQGNQGTTGTTTYPGSSTSGTAENVRERVNEFGSQAREKANEMGRKSAETIDRNLDAAAGKLQSTAESLRNRAGMGHDKMSQMATTAADKLDATARYFRDHHTADMVSGFDHMVRRNPGASLCAALGVGFLLGMAMRKDRY